MQPYAEGHGSQRVPIVTSGAGTDPRCDCGFTQEARRPKGNPLLGCNLRKAAKLASKALAETLWPSRCALCDSPGPVLCQRCKRQLPYIDWLKACPRCGAPWGALICSECNSFVTHRRMGGGFELDGGVSLLASTPESLALTVMLKDRNELRLADELGALLAGALPRTLLAGVPPACQGRKPTEAWPVEAVTWVPARPDALRRRGFDHAQLLAQACAQSLGLPATGLLQARKARDQRKLAAAQRAQNMQKAFFANATMTNACLPKSVLLVDDVYTTGATLMGAATALRHAGVKRVIGATALRVL